MVDALIVLTMKLTTPTEIEQYVLTPYIRKELALALIKRGLTQKDIALILRVSTASVTHYVQGKRASFNFSLEGIGPAADNLVGSRSDFYKVLAQLLKQNKQNGLLCKMYDELTSVKVDDRPCVECKEEKLCYD